jgi:hypothetical protein
VAIVSRLPWLLLGAAFALVSCTRADREPARTPLPTRQTTIDPVNNKLDAAAQDTERRRQDIDNAAK